MVIVVDDKNNLFCKVDSISSLEFFHLLHLSLLSLM